MTRRPTVPGSTCTTRTGRSRPTPGRSTSCPSDSARSDAPEHGVRRPAAGAAAFGGERAHHRTDARLLAHAARDGPRPGPDALVLELHDAGGGAATAAH